MLKYHGTPITPKAVFMEAMKGRNCLIPFTQKQDLKKAFGICDKILIDNGAYTIWRQGISIDWNDYYDWIDGIYGEINYFFIPDVIDGTEEENDLLISNYLKRYSDDKKGIPVWHIDESLHRLQTLMDSFDYIAFGSSGKYRQLGTEQWHKRMNDAMAIICNKGGIPKVKIHMLRCLNPKIFTQYPFYSGDSTNLAQNHSIYNSIQGNKIKNIKPSNDGWKIVIRNIEECNSPLVYKFRTSYNQGSLFE